MYRAMKWERAGFVFANAARRCSRKRGSEAVNGSGAGVSDSFTAS